MYTCVVLEYQNVEIMMRVTNSSFDFVLGIVDCLEAAREFPLKFQGNS